MTSRADFINQQLLLIDGQFANSSYPKHLKMQTSPFVFYRGSVQLFYADLAVRNLAMPAPFLHTPLTTIMGDCHTSNFGFFTEEGSHSQNIVFSLNDFDDACIGHAYWDILRYLVSLALAVDHGQGVQQGNYASDKDYANKAVVGSEKIEIAMQAFLADYANILELGLTNKTTQAHFSDQTFEDFSTPSAISKRYKKAQSITLGGEHFLTKSALAKAIDLTSFPLQFKQNPEKFTRKGVDASEIKAQLSAYFYDHILDVVKRVNSGTGSVNMDRLYLLIGPQNASDITQVSECHVVEVKQQRTAAAIHYFPNLHHQNHLNPAHLTVKCQHRMQRKQDYCLDEAFYKNNHWLIRSRHHAKVGFNPEHITLGSVNADKGGFVFYARACAQALARAHSRCNKGTLTFETEMLRAMSTARSQTIDIATQYSKQVKSDWQWFCGSS